MRWDRRLSLFRPRYPLAPTRGRLGLLIVLLCIALGWRFWHHRPHFLRDFAPESRGVLTGHPRVGDGDSLVFEGARVRLAGIDAPESAQTCDLAGRARACGDEARAHLVSLIAGRPVACDWSHLDKYRRRLARCRAGDTDLNLAMVRDGWAVAYGDFEPVEDEARIHRRGIWAGGFERPEDWRREHRRHAESWWTGWWGDE